jgi:Spy/CpxP family protein refolding chaperone
MRIPFIAAALLTASVAFAAGPAHQPPPLPMDKIAVLLDLDATQKLQVEQILEEQRTAMRAKRQELRSQDKRPTREERQQQHEAVRQATVSKLQTVLGTEQVKKYEALADLMGPGKFRGHRHGERPEK